MTPDMTPTELIVSCDRCGEMKSIVTLKWLIDFWNERKEKYPYCCPNCEAEREAEEQRKLDAEADMESDIIESQLEKAGVPQNYRVTAPPVPMMADFLKRHKTENILLSSPSGTGKSTSAGYLARVLLTDGKNVRYFTLSEFLDQWRDARCSDMPMSVKSFLSYIEWNDVIIIDEAADKTVSTASAQECMFRLLEDITSGMCKARLWFLGNYYRGAIEDVFGNGEAARRRLNEKFYCAMLKNGEIKHIKV